MTPRSPAPGQVESPEGDPLMAIACPGCHALLATPHDWAGTAARCPLCRAGFAVPTPPRAKPLHPARSDGENHLDDQRRTARDEKAARRARRNVARLVVGVVILLAIVLALGTRRRKNRR